MILINLGLKTLIFTKADNAYYYPADLNCDPVMSNTTAEKNDNTTLAVPAPLPPECSDPNYKQKQEQEEKNRRTGQNQHDAAQSLSLILVAAPLFYYHWRLARKEV